MPTADVSCDLAAAGRDSSAAASKGENLIAGKELVSPRPVAQELGGTKKILPGFGVRGVDRKSGLKVCNRLGELSVTRQCHTPVVVRIGVIRTNPQSPPIVRDGLVCLTHANENVAQIDFRVGIVGVRGQRSTIMRDRAIELTQTGENDTPVVFSLVKSRLQRKRRAIALDRLVEGTFSGESDTQVVLSFSELRRCADGMQTVLDRFVDAILPEEDIGPRTVAER